MVAYVTGWQLAELTNGWRWMVGLGACPAVVQLVLMFFFPETPRWLMKSGNTEQARSVLRKTYGTGSHAVVEGLIRAIDLEILEEEEASSIRRQNTGSAKAKYEWLSGLRARTDDLLKVDSHRRGLTIACLLQGLQQLCGFVCHLDLTQSCHSNKPRMPSCTSPRPFLQWSVSIRLFLHHSRWRSLTFCSPLLPC